MQTIQDSNPFLPREIIKWLDSLDLAYSIRNARRDFSNGFIVCEILTRYYPKELNIYTVYNGSNADQKRDNWELISKILSKKDFLLSQQEYEQIYFNVPDVAYRFILRLFEFLTKKKLSYSKMQNTKTDLHAKLPGLILNESKRNVENLPNYARPTAALLSKDRELTRIVDSNEKFKKTKDVLEAHYEKNRWEKQNNNIVEYLLTKKKKQLEEDLKKQSAILSEQRKNEDINPPEIKEIPVKSFNTHAKKKEQQLLFVEGRELLEFFGKSLGPYLEKDPLCDQLKLMNLDENINKVEFILNNSKEFDKKSLKILFLGFKENMDGLLECVNNNHAEFKKIFSLTLPILESLSYDIKAFRLLAEILQELGSNLISLDGTSNQIFFEAVALEQLVAIMKKLKNKYEHIIPIIFSFCQNDSLSKLRMVRKIKEFVKNDLDFFLSILAFLVPYSIEEDMDEDFYNLYLYYSMIALEFPSPIARANGLKIISEISIVNFTPILSFMKKFQKLGKDQWWEVRAQTLITSSNLLLFLLQEDIDFFQNQEKQPNETGESFAKHDKFEKTDMSHASMNNQNLPYQSKAEFQSFLLNLVLEIFNSSTNEHILHIGLIYLSRNLTHYPSLCDRYLEILIKVSEKTRETVLTLAKNATGFDEGKLVNGCNSFKYKINGATKVWNSVGIVQSLNKFVKAEKLEEFKKEHLQIFAGCFVNKLEDKDSEIWISIFEDLKHHIFLALCDKDLCKLSNEMLRKILTFEKIQATILKNSTKIFLKILSMIYHPDTDETCRDNLLEFFNYLNSESEIFKDYLYEIIKEFSEKNKFGFLKSNLVEFMNNLAKERRGKIFGQNFINLS